MTRALFVVSVVTGIFSFLAYQALFKDNGPPPTIEFKQYWGPSALEKSYVENTAITQIEIAYEQEVINNLKRTLDRAPELQRPLEGVGFEYGFNSGKVRPLVDYWRSIYLPKWKTRQEYLNKFKHYVTDINGLQIHFIHAKPTEIAPAVDYYRIPLLLLHGWPGSIREFYDIIPKLTSYSDDFPFAFEVVVPSLVGFGFSSYAQQKGFTPFEMANIMNKLMLRLGYKKYIIQGGDWGSIIGNQMATLFPNNVVGYHSNMCSLHSPRSFLKLFIGNLYPKLFVEEQYIHFHFPASEKLKFLIRESGYFHIQATKPDTIGTALATSPIGLAVYILEKFSIALGFENLQKDDGGLLEMNVDLDAMLDNIMIYYLTNTITSSVRFYAEAISRRQQQYSLDSYATPVPMACARFKNDLPSAFDWQLRDKFPNLVQSTYYNFGGHFAALHEPDTLHADFIAFVRKLDTKLFAKK